jgi:hypothetical protein
MQLPAILGSLFALPHLGQRYSCRAHTWLLSGMARGSDCVPERLRLQNL